MSSPSHQLPPPLGQHEGLAMATAEWEPRKGWTQRICGREGLCCCCLCPNQTLFATVLPALTAKPLAWSGSEHGRACPKYEQAPDPSFHRSHFPAPQQLPEQTEILQSAFCFSPDKGITNRGWEPGRRCQQRGLGKRGRRLLVFFCRAVFIFFFSLRSCSVILFYFLALQAAGRITWLPGKPLESAQGCCPHLGTKTRLPARIPLPPALPGQAGRSRNSSQPSTCSHSAHMRG